MLTLNKLITTSLLTQTIALSALAGVPSIDNIKIASSVPSDQAARIIKDIQTLKTMSFSNPDPQMIKLMEIPDANASTLISWMESRVNFIVDENFALDSTTISADNQSFDYPNPTATPTLETPTQTPTGNSQIQTVMLNIGGAIYYSGKQEDQLLDVQIPGVGKEVATSPRIGIIKVGSGLFRLFQNDTGKDPATVMDTMPYLAFRLSTLIHEARHSDGNGTSLGFFHAVCPSGIYEGYSACDRNLNGPYQIETTFLNSIAQSCTSCSAGDKAAIQVIAADAASRQIVSSVDPSDNSQQQIQLLQSELQYCQIISTLPAGTIPADPTSPINCADTASIQAQITALQNGGVAQIPSTMWDATPEGSFSAN